MGEIWDILPGLGDKLAAHVVLSASAIGLAMLIALHKSLRTVVKDHTLPAGRYVMIDQIAVDTAHPIVERSLVAACQLVDGQPVGLGYPGEVGQGVGAFQAMGVVEVKAELVTLDEIHGCTETTGVNVRTDRRNHLVAPDPSQGSTLIQCGQEFRQPTSAQWVGVTVKSDDVRCPLFLGKVIETLQRSSVGVV